jgi:hypothetical protein
MLVSCFYKNVGGFDSKWLNFDRFKPREQHEKSAVPTWSFGNISEFA